MAAMRAFMQTFCPPLYCWMLLAAGADEEDAFGRFRDGLRGSQSIIEDSSKNWNWITLALNAASRITFEPPFRSRASTTSPRTGQHGFSFSSCAPPAAAAAAKGKLSIG
ncbi:hypothetical protein DAPPUDRAFT_103422 [Daphnia pulex]|uniref:Secreted protein n=1 Tax=Daphnia pulex TaxID=6669 RepID=E9GJ90_DAPPU|nr:hypothetical protein DAPPUDRAFT_103422 [Daphnia pulex]|eukprot:EFX80527.1 hypothetical protein DAPPUDRAFT_103422 [Daphnia pulex]